LEGHRKFHVNCIDVLPPIGRLGDVWTRHRINWRRHLRHIVLG
jgi:hypothetical protein